MVLLKLYGRDTEEPEPVVSFVRETYTVELKSKRFNLVVPNKLLHFHGVNDTITPSIA